jgi:hypothetical protein
MQGVVSNGEGGDESDYGMDDDDEDEIMALAAR